MVGKKFSLSHLPYGPLWFYRSPVPDHPKTIKKGSAWNNTTGMNELLVFNKKRVKEYEYDSIHWVSILQFILW